MTTQETDKILDQIEDAFYAETRRVSQMGGNWNVAKANAERVIRMQFPAHLVEKFLNEERP